MDSVTHALLGATIAQLGFRRKIGRETAWVAAFAAYSPDLDAFVSPLLRAFGDDKPLLSLTVHRGISHSLLAAPIIALMVAGAWWSVRGRLARRKAVKAALPPPAKGPPFALMYACLLLAVASHPLLDWCTSYGTQLFAPLTNARYAIDAVAIVDVLYTPILILTLAACYLTRKLARTQGAAAAVVIGWAGFLAGVGYLAAGRAMHDLAVRKALAIAQPQNVVSANAYPSLGTILVWRAVIETPEEWIVMRIHQFAGSDRRPVPQVAQRQDDRWIDLARLQPEVRTYEWFAMGQLRAESIRKDDGTRLVEFHDMRYSWISDSERSLWPLSVVFDRSGRVQRIGRMMEGHHGRDFAQAARTIWREIWHP